MQDAISTILGTFLGALLGILGGLAINFLWSHHVDKTRRQQLRAAIKNAVESNAKLVEQMADWIAEPGCTPFFNVDLPLLESTAALKYEVLGDIGLCREIDHLRFELVHLSRKVDLLLDLDFDPSARLAISDPKGSMYNILRPPLVESLKVHIGTVKDVIATVQVKLQ